LPTEGFDLVVCSSHCVAKGVRPPRRGALLAYVHSPMRYVWDRFDDYLGQGWARDAALRAFRGPLQRWDVRTSRELDSIACNSRFVSDRVASCWGRKSRVIHPHVDLEFFSPDETVEANDDFLVVSALVPYKRVDRAIEAARLAGRRLNIIGDGPDRARLQRLARGGARFLGWRSNEELRDAYRRSAALIYPGVEDFGITSLEAQACGRPVLALGEGGASESVLSGETGAFFREPTAESLAALLTSFRAGDYDPARCRAQAERFSAARFRSEAARWILGEVRLRC